MKLLELFDSEKKWIKGDDAQNKDGGSLYDVKDKNAVKWCLVGGLYKCYKVGSKIFDRNENKLVKVIAEDYKYGCIIDFNDAKETTWSDIKKVLKKAGI